jgi:pantoate--beta-alanine ligase
MLMKIIETISELKHELEVRKAKGMKTGFVPTMGALHRGHISLVERARKENETVIVSIFVNPTQFTNSDDLKNYPRSLQPDAAMLEPCGVDFIFAPSVSEIYSENEKQNATQTDFGNLDKVLEGKFRSGHFQGVAQVVSKLFDIVEADKAYFGEKDFQQLAIIRELVRQKKYPVEIIGCPTIREADGLAMSSRNQLLSTEERKEATVISRALFFVRDNVQKYSVDELKKKATEMIEATGKFKIDYLEIAEEKTLQSVSDWNDSLKLRCLTAANIGRVRLIDNIAFD